MKVASIALALSCFLKSPALARVSSLTSHHRLEETAGSVQILEDYPVDPSRELFAIARICCGCETAFTDSENEVWSADTAFVDGVMYSCATGINGTTDDGLFQNERYGTFTYNIDLPSSGVYKVTLFFAEIYHLVPDARKFSVFIEGQAPSSLSNIDLVAEVGPFTATEKTVWLEMPDKTMNIDFTSIKDNAKVSAILVESMIDPTAPVPAPVSPPSAAPIAAPTAAPVKAPVAALTTAPVKAPVAAPVMVTAPVEAPVAAPITPEVPAPMPAPVSPPVSQDKAPPRPSTTPFGGCFSLTNTVEVQGKGLVSMDSLQIGDLVRAGSNRFSRVYSFIHLDRDAEATFLQIHTTGWDTPLEMTPEHMVFVDRAAVRASQVKVGDMLGENKVSAIKPIKRRGVFAPVTESGDIVVNGALASSYAAVVAYAPVNQHYGAHAFFAARRLVCALNFDICEGETYVDGFPTWLSSVIHFVAIVEDNPAIQFCASILALPFITATFMLEQLILSPFLSLGMFVLGLFVFCKKVKASKVKAL